MILPTTASQLPEQIAGIEGTPYSKGIAIITLYGKEPGQCSVEQVLKAQSPGSSRVIAHVIRPILCPLFCSHSDIANMITAIFTHRPLVVTQ